MDFRDADRRYDALKRQYRDGNLSAEQLEAQLKEIMVQDRDGNWWSKHTETGEWYYYDGSTWVQRNPPDYEYEPPTAQEQPPPAQEQPPPVREQPRVQTSATDAVRAPGAAVPGYLMPLSIGATLLCCPATGIPAIVYSVQARSKSQAGDTAGASQAIKNANIWLWVSVGLGLVGYFFYFIIGASSTTGY
jgi:Interferon-induced transmembrane protein